ncbi:MAG: hypothetical protein HY975_00650 [Candidatus Kerfeldbacteria bacterium]|nr:hypothetical protein [Candidatus Kerfeldbacteria bacterium]
MTTPERFEQEPRFDDPEWYISELRTLSARWSEVDVKRPLESIDLSREDTPVDLPAPNEQELRLRERIIAQRLQTAVEQGMFNDEQKQRLIAALAEAVHLVDEEPVQDRLVMLKNLLETGRTD